MNRICITGTGRSGTTFLMRLLSLMGLQTGYTIEDINNNKSISPSCNSGLEYISYNKPKAVPLIFKDPNLIVFPEDSIKKYNVKHVIIPIRSLKESAESRARLDKGPGGLWRAKNEKEQIEMYRLHMSDFWNIIAEYDLDLTVISFNKMINDKTYLYHKLTSVFDLDQKLFYDNYELASNLSKR